MADTKISALTAATTPLAGTEALPLVQTSTKKATVQNVLDLGFRWIPYMSTGLFFFSDVDIQNATTGAVAANTIYAQPIYITNPITALSLNLQNVSVAGTAGTQVRMGIYKMKVGGTYPDSLVLDCGQVLTDTTGTKTLTISQALTPGWYFMAAVFSGTPTVNGFSGQSASRSLLGYPTAAGIVGSGYVSVTGTLTYGALPATFPAVTYVTNQGPRMCIGT